MKGKSVACTLLQLFNKVSIIVQVPTAPVSGTSSSWAVEQAGRKRQKLLNVYLQRK